MRFLEFNKPILETTFLMERDVANAPEIKKWVMDQAAPIADQIAKNWYRSQLFDYLINQTENPEMVVQLNDITDDSPDWLKAKIEAGSPVFQVRPSDEFMNGAAEVRDWVANFIDENPGARINYNWEQAVKATIAWHKELAQGADHGEETFDDEGIMIFYEHEDGHKWVDVRSNVCLKREGGRMGHCVGSYHKQVERNETRILSLRSPNNTPRVTIDVVNLDLGFWHSRDKDYEANQSRRKEDDLIAQWKEQNPDQKIFPFMNKPSADPLHTLKPTGSIGAIQQVKGKQNRAPVPKYIPYVKEFIEAFPFDIDYGGKRDLESIGYYYRDGKLTGLKDISRVFMKLPNGMKWVAVKNDADNSEFSWGAVKLVDKKWTPHAEANVESIEDGKLVLKTIHIEDGKSFPEEIKALINHKSTNPDNLSGYTLRKADMYVGDGGISANPREAAGPKGVGELSNGISVIKLGEFNTYSSQRDMDLMLFKDDVYIGQANFVTIASKRKLVDINFSGGTKLDHPEHIETIALFAKKIKVEVYDPERYGLDKNLEVVDLSSTTEELGISYNDKYTYRKYVKPNADDTDDYTVIVTEIDGNIPLISINIDAEQDVAQTYSGLVDERDDDGLFGFVIIDLHKKGYIRNRDDSLKNILADHHWGVDYQQSDYWYVDGLSKLMHHIVQTRWNYETNEEEVIQDITGGWRHIEEDVFGHEVDEYSASDMATYLATERYSHKGYHPDDDDTEIEYDQEMEMIDHNDVSSTNFEYANYDYDSISKMADTGYETI